MSDLDRYDVEAMIRDALVEARHEWKRELERIEYELRNEIGTERVERQDALEAVSARIER